MDSYTARTSHRLRERASARRLCGVVRLQHRPQLVSCASEVFSVRRRNTVLILASLISSVSPLSDSPLSAQVTGGSQVDAILACERAACAACERNDAAAIDSLVHDSYTLTDSKGVITTKADEIREAQTSVTIAVGGDP